MQPLIVSLCTGYGGLDIAAEYVTGGRTIYVADNDPAASAVLAVRWPRVVNLGDITSMGYLEWERIARADKPDVLTAGFPCQDVSVAGYRKGLRAGTRTGLWANIADVINILRPSLVILENVRGLLYAGADSNLEHCAWCLGEAGAEHDLRALGAVLGDLSDCGFDAEWVTVPASIIGAPHKRERVFVAAWPATNPGRGGLEGVWGDAGTQQGRPSPPGFGHGPARGGQAAGNTEQPGLEGRTREGVEGAGRSPVQPAGADWAWGRHDAAVRRWERILGRRAPDPVDPGRRADILNPAFVEWMMGLPQGWVTDVPGLEGKDMLRVLGNGVVPHQAIYALDLLRSRV